MHARHQLGEIRDCRAKSSIDRRAVFHHAAFRMKTEHDKAGQNRTFTDGGVSSQFHHLKRDKDWIRNHNRTRKREAQEICNAYEVVARELAHVGKLLRTTEAGKYLWSTEHKSAVTGLRTLVEMLRLDVPLYDEGYDGGENGQ
jgi:hypothetical protein